MRYGSVCSGVEAATVAWHPLGWQAAWYSEIEPFPCAVLKHHYPTVPNYGDMTQYEAWPNEPINLLVGGTPCQSFSVAGLRKGLADPRGNLMLTYGAIAKRYRPRWLVWENVPGVLSSNGGRDFGAFLGMLAELGYGFAYRVLDAQYFGVAQRRRRVFVVGYLGDWHRAAAVLFERHSLQGHPAPSRETEQENAAAASCGVELCGPLNARDYKDPGTDGMNVNSAKMIPVFPMHGGIINRKEKNGPGGTGFGEENGSSYTLTAGGIVKHGVVIAEKVRQLTPMEYERLQGFPDNYTNIPWRNKTESPDGPRYKAMGNSMAVPVMRWIGERIAAVDAL